MWEQAHFEFQRLMAVWDIKLGKHFVEKYLLMLSYCTLISLIWMVACLVQIIIYLAIQSKFAMFILFACCAMLV